MASPTVSESRPGGLRRFGRSLIGTNAQAIAFYVGLFVFWEYASGTLIREYLLPAPSTIVEAMVDQWDPLVSNSWVTLQEILIGFAIGSGAGFLMGVGIFYSGFLRRVLYPGALFTQTVPKIALAPLFIVWFGVGQQPIIAITALICLFPVLINTVAGLESVDPRLLELMHSVSASGWQKFRMIHLPSGLPSIMAGLEVASTLAVVGALVGEFVGANAGLGYQILIANSRLRTDLLFAA
ncbi:MAG: ABC transporter permease, partial [Acidimicrobiia bacterium]|nr:ABC transporter permease [Acidimicrobiia bacterium]